jgi:hypothetical protein
MLVESQGGETEASDLFFLFSSCCLAGRAYPLGDIPEDLVPLVKNQVSIIFMAFLLSALLNMTVSVIVPFVLINTINKSNLDGIAYSYTA